MYSGLIKQYLIELLMGALFVVIFILSSYFDPNAVWIDNSDFYQVSITYSTWLSTFIVFQSFCIRYSTWLKFNYPLLIMRAIKWLFVLEGMVVLFSMIVLTLYMLMETDPVFPIAITFMVLSVLYIIFAYINTKLISV